MRHDREFATDSGAVYQFAYTLDRASKIAQTDITDPRGHVERLTFNADHYIVTEVEAHEEFIRVAVTECSPRLVIIQCVEG
jgi:hypothetical protein